METTKEQEFLNCIEDSYNKLFPSFCSHLAISNPGLKYSFQLYCEKYPSKGIRAMELIDEIESKKKQLEFLMGYDEDDED